MGRLYGDATVPVDQDDVRDGGAFSIFAQGVPGISAITVTSSGQTGTIAIDGDGPAPSIVIVGVAAAVVAAIPVSGVAVVHRGR